jgi:hypothetical protein
MRNMNIKVPPTAQYHLINQNTPLFRLIVCVFSDFSFPLSAAGELLHCHFIHKQRHKNKILYFNLISLLFLEFQILFFQFYFSSL